MDGKAISDTAASAVVVAELRALLGSESSLQAPDQEVGEQALGKPHEYARPFALGSFEPQASAAVLAFGEAFEPCGEPGSTWLWTDQGAE